MSELPTTVSTPEAEVTALSRRRALAKLGLAAAVAYAAPTIVRLDRTANAKVAPSPCPPAHAKGSGAPWCK